MKDKGKKKNNVISLADRANSNKLWTPEQMLRAEADRLRDGKRKATKAVILFLDDTDGAYKTGWAVANLRCSESIALLEIMKDPFKELMGQS